MLSECCSIKLNKKWKILTQIFLLMILFALVQTTTPNSSPPQKRAGSQDVIRDHCNKTVDIYEDVASPELTNQNRFRPMTCWYRFRNIRGASRDWVLRLRFKKFKVGTLVNATQCEGGYLQIVDGNAKTDVSNRREPGMFCGEAEQPQVFISETSYVKIVFHTDNFTDQTYFAFDSRAEQQMEVYLRYGQHPELYPNRRGEVVQGSYCEREFRDCRLQTCYVQSPAYPGIYPRSLHCKYRLHTRQPFIKLYLQNEAFSVDGQRCENIMTCPMKEIGSGADHCPYDWLAVYDGKDEFSPLIGKFCGTGKFPFSIIGTSQYMYVEFVSSPAGPLLNTGFHFNVGNWPGHVDTAGVKNGACDWLLTSDALKLTSASEGIFLSVAHWYPPGQCSYHIQGREHEIVRLYFPSFRINRIEAPIVKVNTDCAESLTIYDAPHADPARIIKTFCDTFSRPMEKVDFISTGRSLFVKFVSKTGSYSGSSLYYWAHYDFFNNTKHGDPVAGTMCDEVFPAWKYTKGKLRSPQNTLIFKRVAGNSDIRCQYKFMPDKRLFARIVIEVTNVSFKTDPYSPSSCTKCHEERVDKLMLWEEKDRVQNRLACFCDNIPRPVRVMSSGEYLNLELMIQGQHAVSSYFKNPNTLFEASYEFAHGPICGPIVAGCSPCAKGELVFPFRNALGMPIVTEQRKEKCIWELRVAQQRDLWLHLEKAKFGDRGCDGAKIEVFLAGSLTPRYVICPENASMATDIPILSASDLGAIDNTQEPPPVIIQYTGDNSPGKNVFKFAWSELYHLPRLEPNLVPAQLVDACDFHCPGNTNVCLPRHLVCDGIVNCPPNVTLTETALETVLYKIEQNLESLGIIDKTVFKDLYHLSDESPELCSLQLQDKSQENVTALQLLLLMFGMCSVLILLLGVIFKFCRRK